jgi:glucose-6-phosphate 1-dehydrogenase
VSPTSNVETYVALRLTIDNWRWAGVPFYIRTGKKLGGHRTEIAIQFKQAPAAIFRDTPVDSLTPNVLTLRVQPDEGIGLEFSAKEPGQVVRLSPVSMDFSYDKYFQLVSSTGYETLIYDALIGDATLFNRADNIDAGWAAVQPVLDGFARDAVPLCRYAAGSEGPVEADEMLARDGRAWRKV